MSRKKRKKQPEKKTAETVLRNWRLDRLERDRELPVPAPGPSEVTLLCYFVRPSSEVADAFPALECAVRETWRHCGFLRTVFVADRDVPEIREFAAPFGPWVELQIETSLDPARPETIHADANARLFERFRTPRVLLVREDAFPIRPGLGSFLDDWDFVGAPLDGGGLFSRFLHSIFNTHAMDGGLSLRSRRLCEAACGEWNSRHSAKPWRTDWAENLFRTKYLPRVSIAYRSAMRFPVPCEAARFSWNAVSQFRGSAPPFGFSGANAFKWLLDNGRIS